MTSTELTLRQEPALRARARWRLQVLDGFALIGPDGAVEPQPATARLLALLAILGDPAPRARVATTLWLDTSDRQAGANLRSLLWRVQQQHAGLITVTPERVRLSEHVTSDLCSRRGRARALLADRVDPEPADIDLLAAELLPDWYDDWVIMERERDRQRRLHGLETLCRWFSSHGQHGLGLDAGLAAITVEPLRESAHRVVIAAHLAEGNTTEALRQYRHYERLLAAELGLRPSSGLRGLIVGALPDREPSAAASR